MPEPFLMLGVAAVLAGDGIRRGVRGEKNRRRAKRTRADAQASFDRAARSLAEMRRSSGAAVTALGKERLAAYDETVRLFAAELAQLKNLDLTDLQETGEFRSEIALGRLNLGTVDFSVVDGLKTALASGAAGTASGFLALGGVGTFGAASTGTSIATLSGVAAQNATLAWFGGGSLATGGMGMAGGTAVLGGIFAAPILWVGGAIYDKKMSSAVEAARSDEAKAAAAVADMEQAKRVAAAIRRRAVDISHAITRLRGLLDPRIPTLADRVRVQTDYSRWPLSWREDLYLWLSGVALLRALLDVRVVSESGGLSIDSREALKAGVGWCAENEKAA